MKTGLGLYKKYRLIYAYLNLFRFSFRKYVLGFDVANLFIQRVDKKSMSLILKWNGAKIGKDCDIETGLIFHNCKSFSNLKIGNNCHIGKNCFFDLRNEITIENNVVISMQCTFITHIDMSKSKLSEKYPAINKPIRISDNTYIGARSTILMGVNIGENAFIAAGALVNKSVDKNSFSAGVPIKPLTKM